MAIIAWWDIDDRHLKEFNGFVVNYSLEFVHKFLELIPTGGKSRKNLPIRKF